jgi:asparagine synthase (glutamine-hydrolysing)
VGFIVCGLTGFTRGFSFDRAVIKRATATLTHRGPDHLGVFQSEDIALGAVRLRVIDPAAADQPLVSEGGRFALAYNGEVYNHAELRRELESVGYRFRSRCDTEVVLAAFEQWGTRCFERFRGMFAIAIWDACQQRLVLARDRLGIKPLYIYRSGRDLCFGSELKAIFAHPSIPRLLDWDALRDYLSLNYVPGPRTLIKGIEKLPPGHFLEFANGVARTECYWQLPHSPARKISVGDASVILDDLLTESIREHTISDMPLGVWLSGGLDSTTIVDYVARHSSKPVKTFSVAFESQCCDESKYFQEVARFYGTQHEEIELRPTHDVIEAISEFAEYSDEPGADAGALPVWFLSKMSRRHVTVALSGEGSDEIFGGYLTYKANRYADILRRAPESLRAGALKAIDRLWPVSDNKISFEYKLKRLLRGSMMHPDEAHVYWNGTFAPDELRSMIVCAGDFGSSNDSLRSLYSSLRLGFEPSATGLNRFLQFDQSYYLPDNLLYKVDRMSMAHSLEVRPPFLDHRIVEFAAALPDDLKIRGGAQKFLLRHLMRDRLPKGVLGRRKAGFDIPAHRWLRCELRPLLRETLSPRAVKEAGIFNSTSIQMLIDGHMDRTLNVGYHLWGLMTLHLWLKKWNVDTCPPAEQEAYPIVHAYAS